MSNGIVLTLAQIKETVHSLASKYQNIKTVTLIGSYAHGEADSESDLDFIIDLSGEADSDAYFSFLDDLESTFDKEIDLLTSDGVIYSPIKDSLTSGGILLYFQKGTDSATW
jgi:predicted nucleotidyltransferase